MRVLVGPPEPALRHVGVDLGAGERAVAEHLLDRPEIGAAVEQVAGE